MTADESLAVLKRFVDDYVGAIQVVLEVVTDGKTPAPARRVLTGALNYVLDLLDLFPDHFQGLGVADDAIVLRLAARHAVAAGATQARLHELAADAHTVDELLGDLAAPLARYVEMLPERIVSGRTVAQILGHPEVFARFATDVEQQIATHHPRPIDPTLSAVYHLSELRRMIKHGLKRSGLVP